MPLRSRPAPPDVAEFRISATAEAEILRILASSEADFGPLARARYAVLIDAAMADLAANPDSPLAAWHVVSGIRLGLYHLDHSRKHVPVPPGRVGNPRHALIFRVAQDRIVEFIGIIHDNMLHARALRKSLRASPDLS